MIIFYLLNLIAGFTVYSIIKKFIKIASFLDYIICFMLILTSQIILLELSLGILGILSLRNVFIANILILALVFLIPKAKNSNLTASANFPACSDGFKLGKLEYFCLSVLIGFGLVKVFINLVNPPFGWDNLNYHFTFPVEWIKSGNLSNPIVVSDDPAPSFYPINASLIFLWLMLPLKSVFIADLGSLPFYLLCGVLVYRIGCIILPEKRYAFFASLLFLLIPNIFKQIEIAYIDIIVCAFYLAAFYFILRLHREFKVLDAVMAGISLGLLIGTKSLALVYGITLLLPLFFIIFRLKAKGLQIFVLVISLIIIFGGYSYIKNFILTGNPLYPIDVVIGGKMLFKGVIDKASYGAHFTPGDYNLIKILYHEGLGAQSTLFVIPGLILGFPLLFLKSKARPRFLDYYFALIPLILFLIWRFIIPLANVRYLSPLLAVSILYGFNIFMRFVPRKITLFLIFVCTMASISEFSKHAELIASLILSVVLFFVLLKVRIKRLFAFFLLAVLLFILIFLNHNYRQNEFKRYNNSPFWKDAYLSWQWLEENTKGDNISYVGRPVPFPLYGKNFKNSVYYTSVNSIDPAKLYFYKGSRYTWGYDFLECHRDYEKDNNYRGRADYGIWLSNLRKKNTDFLYVYSLHQIKGIEFPVEDKWAKLNKDVFEPVFINETIHIYKVK